MPEEIRYYTADTVAETMPLEPFESPEVQALMRKLWSFVTEAKNPTPLGGDGSNGTVEEPSGRLNPENDDKAPHWWERLNEAEQQLIVDAVAKEFGSFTCKWCGQELIGDQKYERCPDEPDNNMHRKR